MCLASHSLTDQEYCTKTIMRQAPFTLRLVLRGALTPKAPERLTLDTEVHWGRARG